MTFTDPATTLISLFNTIVLTPNSLPSITLLVSGSWLDVSSKGGPAGEITPQITVSLVSAVVSPLTGDGSVSEMRMTYQVDVWTQGYGPTENPLQLKEKMAEAIRQKILANRNAPSTTIKFMELISEADRDEVEYKPILRRRLMLVRCTCLRT